MNATHLDKTELAENWLESRPDECMLSGYPVHWGTGSTCALVYMVLEPGGAVGTHEHDVEEVILVLEGSAEVWVGEERQRVEPRAVVVVPAGAAHGLRGGTGVVRAVGFFPSGSVVTRFAERVMPDGETVLGTPDVAG